MTDVANRPIVVHSLHYLCAWHTECADIPAIVCVAVVVYLWDMSLNTSSGNHAAPGRAIGYFSKLTGYSWILQ